MLPLWSIHFYTLIDVIGAIAPPLVSLVLAYLYLQLRDISSDQRDIDQTQRDIQRQQQQLLELAQLPQLIVDSWQIDDDQIEFEISNVGDGAAYNIGYVLEAIPFEITNPPIQTESNPTFDFDRMLPFARADDDISQHKNTLEAGKTGTFTETACLTFEQGETYRPFTSGSTDLEYPEAECYVNLRLWLTYNDAVHDELQSQPVIDISLKREQVEGQSFEEAMCAEPVGDTRYGDGSRMVLPDNVDESRLQRFRRSGRTTTYIE
ncbi:hypothetical protein NDI54_19990 [Haloarcula sp. S1AR25-5A]|uniref:Uncharacterized protein n=1 Tax=Haloarcula terrestris TaxID=2950533 RepID=A0AAE4JL19_9EURY|nr:hypothetical protein [Haloarcula terrestris]MDS0223626.1 hypothetical protein [Haloarcula terrestris]